MNKQAFIDWYRLMHNPAQVSGKTLGEIYDAIHRDGYEEGYADGGWDESIDQQEFMSWLNKDDRA